MPRPCSICQHAERPAIDQALVSGVSAPRIAAEYRVSEDAALRHKAHIAARIQEATDDDTRQAAALAHQQAAQKTQEARQALDVIEQLRAINGATLTILKRAHASKDDKVALLAVDRVQKQIELQARLLGDLDDRPVVNVLITPQWITLRAVILSALADYPEARAALAVALQQVDDAR